MTADEVREALEEEIGIAPLRTRHGIDFAEIISGIS